MERSHLALIIPALNEEKTITDVVHAAKIWGQVIVVDDGSKDATALYAESAGAVIVRHSQNKGYDQALSSGFKKASELENVEFVITLDADGQHDPELIGQFLSKLQNSADVVSGIRDRKQRIGEFIFAFCASKFYRIHDPLCGMKGYRISVFRSLGHFDSYGSIGTELAIFAVTNGMKLSEVPIKTRVRKGNPRFASSLRGNYLILRALLYSFFRYPIFRLSRGSTM